MTHVSPIQQRLQITFGKMGPLKYTGHLDIAKIWERVLRRADLPILYTKGFNTRPRIHLALATPLGITSECEIVDVALREVIDITGVREKLLAVSPAGLEIHNIQEVDPQAPTLETLIRSAEYRVHFGDGIDRGLLQGKIDAVLGAAALPETRERKGRQQTQDLRPLIYALYIDESGDLIAHVAAGSRGNLRPDALMRLLGLEGVYHSVHRLRLHIAEPHTD